MKTIALIANSSWNIFNFRIPLIRELNKRGYKTYVIAPEDKYSNLLQTEGIDVILLKNLSRKGTNPIKDLSLIFEIRKLILQNQIDLILNYTIKPVIYGSLASRVSKNKSISTITGLGFAFLSKGWINKLVLSLYKYSLKYSDLIIFQNPDDRILFSQLGLINKNKTKLIAGSGINTNHFNNTNSIEQTEHFNFLFVGRFLYDKGILEYLKAAKALNPKYKNLRFHLIGALDDNNPSGLTKNDFEKWTQDESIIYHGELMDVRPIMTNADVVVLPSYREGLPRVLLEALSMSKPIITTDAPGCRETVIEGENGYLVEVKDSTALSLAMERIITDGEEKRNQMGLMSRKLALEKFDETIILSKYLEEIEQILK